MIPSCITLGSKLGLLLQKKNVVHSATILIKMWLVNYCNNSLIRSKVGSIFRVVAIAPLKKALMHRMEGGGKVLNFLDRHHNFEAWNRQWKNKQASFSLVVSVAKWLINLLARQLFTHRQTCFASYCRSIIRSVIKILALSISPPDLNWQLKKVDHNKVGRKFVSLSMSKYYFALPPTHCCFRVGSLPWSSVNLVSRELIAA